MSLTREQIEGLKCYRVVTSKGRLIIMPFIREGEYADFRARVYIKGSSGHIEATQEAVGVLGLPVDFADKAKEVASRLSGYYPALPSPSVMMAEAQLAGLPAGKTEGAKGEVVEGEVKPELERTL